MFTTFHRFWFGICHHPYGLVVLAMTACNAAGPDRQMPDRPMTKAATMQLSVGPNVWMDPHTRFPEDDLFNPGELVPQVESDLAVDPNNPDHIVCSVVYFHKPLKLPNFKHANARAHGVHGFTLYSTDGGKTWAKSGQPGLGNYNLCAVYSKRHGDAHRNGIGKRSDQGGVDIQRSTDQGKTWTRQVQPRQIEGADLFDADHPRMAVDNHPDSPHYGRVYLASPGYYLAFSDHRAEPGTLSRSTTKISEHITGIVKPGATGVYLIDGVHPLPTGEVLVVFRHYLKIDGAWRNFFRFRMSSDGGRTLGEERAIVDLPMHPFEIPETPGKAFYRGVGTENHAKLAVDPDSGRLYCAYTDPVEGKLRLHLIHSDDKGLTWSDPRLVSPDLPEHTNQFQLNIVVNRHGHVGIGFFDTRRHPDESAYDKYLAVSSDGGLSFQECLINDQPIVPTWDFKQHELPRHEWLVPGFDARRHMTGGDYLGLDADSDGNFLTTWVDWRNEKRPQLYFCEISVEPSVGSTGNPNHNALETPGF